MRQRSLEWLFWGIGIAFALLFIPKLFWGDSALYQEIITERVSLAFSAPTKLLMLCLASFFCAGAATTLGGGNPASRPWWILAAGVGLFAVAQAILGYYQLVLAERAPFPSPADPPFLLGTVLMVVAAIAFVVVYVRSGLAMGTTREVVLSAVVAAAPLALVAVIVLVPIATADAAFTELLFNLGYPTLDLVLIVAAFVLFRLMRRLRGGQLWLVWARILGGVLFMAVGDILFAYFTTLATLEFSALDPLIDLTFAYGYILLAWGSYTQYTLLSSQGP